MAQSLVCRLLVRAGLPRYVSVWLTNLEFVAVTHCLGGLSYSCSSSRRREDPMAQLLCVNGPEAANSLSVALVHEHLFLDHSRLLQRPPLPLDLEHLADIRQQPSRWACVCALRS